jgi:hemolysin III
MSHIAWQADHSRKIFFKRTVAAQLHFLGMIAALVGFAVLLHFALLTGDSKHILACSIFGITGVGVFAASTFYHFLSDGFTISERLHQFVKDLDHSSIFLFIAGTYTPFIINVFSSPWDRILMILVWTIGMTGVLYVFLRRRLPAWARNRFIYTGIFLAMGWTLLIRLGEALSFLSPLAIFFLIAGGLSYSFGAVVYAMKWPNPFKDTFGFHEIWHVMVILGFAFHYFLILGFYWPS